MHLMGYLLKTLKIFLKNLFILHSRLASTHVKRRFTFVNERNNNNTLSLCSIRTEVVFPLLFIFIILIRKYLLYPKKKISLMASCAWKLDMRSVINTIQEDIHSCQDLNWWINDRLIVILIECSSRHERSNIISDCVFGI